MRTDLAPSTVAALATFVLLSTSGCSREVDSPALGIRFEPPSRMKFVSERAEPVPTAIFESGLELRAVKQPLPAGDAASLTAMLEQAAREAQLSLKGEVQSSKRGTIPAGEVARYELSDAKTRTLLYVIRGEGRYVVLILNAPKDDYAPLESQVERALSTLRFR